MFAASGPSKCPGVTFPKEHKVLAALWAARPKGKGGKTNSKKLPEAARALDPAVAIMSFSFAKSPLPPSLEVIKPFLKVFIPLYEMGNVTTHCSDQLQGKNLSKNSNPKEILKISLEDF